MPSPQKSVSRRQQELQRGQEPEKFPPTPAFGTVKSVAGAAGKDTIWGFAPREQVSPASAQRNDVYLNHRQGQTPTFPNWSAMLPRNEH